MHPSGRTMEVSELYEPISRFIGMECTVRQVAPDSVRKVYLPGITSVLLQQQRVTNFGPTVSSPLIKNLIVGYNRNWVKKHPEAGKVKIPFGVALAISTREALASGALSLQAVGQSGNFTTAQVALVRARIFLALLFGIFFLLRKGEYLPSVRQKRRADGSVTGYVFTRDMLTFYNAQDEPIPYGLVGFVPALSVRLSILFSKMDQTGHGRVMVHYRQEVQVSACIVRELEGWVSYTRDWFGMVATDLMWAVPGLPPFTCETITLVMKAMCDLLGLPVDKISARLLRYGGVSTLGMAGYPEYIIAFCGAWLFNSKAMRVSNALAMPSR